MNPQELSIVQQALRSWSPDLDVLRQNKLLDESAFIGFARVRSLVIQGASAKDLLGVCSIGWLKADGKNPTGRPLFHPFRVYSLFKILEACEAKGAAIGDVVRPLDPTVLEEVPAATAIAKEVIDLAILLEPAYWPSITKTTSRIIRLDVPHISEGEYEARRAKYADMIRDFVSKLDPKEWYGAHQTMRLDAARIDGNKDLYVLLRLATWKQREKLTGAVGGGLWIRHIAETIRRAFEEIHKESWPEEDQGFEKWSSGGRKLVYGSERPLDNEAQARSHITVNYGLLTGSSLRWYIEGQTEEAAIRKVLQDPSDFGIELVNLRGIIAAERDNIALKLGEWLTEDKAQKRYSVISFDKDVPENIKTVRRQIERGRVVGFIAAHDPDFEFANFTIQELVEIAAKRDESEGFSGDVLRNANWAGITTLKAFEERYQAVSERKRSLKDEKWGQALGAYAIEHPNRSDTGAERPFWNQITMTLRARLAPYDSHQERYKIDPSTFELIERKTVKGQAGHR